MNPSEITSNTKTEEKQTNSTQSQFSPGALPKKPPAAGFAPNAGAAAALPKSEGAGAGEVIVIVMAQHVSISNKIRRLSTIFD